MSQPYVELPAASSAARLDAPGGPLAVLDVAPRERSGASVLLVPGFTGSKEDFAAVLAPMADAGHRVVALDLRGQFESVGSAEPAAYAVPALAADVISVVDWMDDGPVHVLGHSFGGFVVRRAVIEKPSAFRSLTLLASGPAGITGKRAVWLRRLRSVLARGGVPLLWEATEALSAGDPRMAGRSDEEKAFRRRQFLATHPVAMAVMGQELLDEPDAVSELARSGVPVLVAHGAEDDAWPQAVQAEMARELGAAYAAVPEAYHAPMVEAPEATAKAALEFWVQVERA